MSMFRNNKMIQLVKSQHRSSTYSSMALGLSALGIGAAGSTACSPTAKRKPLTTVLQSEGQFSNLSLQFVVQPNSEGEVLPEGNTVDQLAEHANSQLPPAQLKYCIDVKAKTSPSEETYNCNFYELIQSGQKFQIQEKVWNGSDDPSNAGSGFPAKCSFEPAGQITQFRCTYSAAGKLFPCTSYPDELTLANAEGGADGTASDPIALLTIEVDGQAGNYDISALDFSNQKNVRGSPFPKITDAAISPSLNHQGGGEDAVLIGCAALFNPAIEGHELVSAQGKVVLEGNSEPPDTSGQQASSQWTFIYSGQDQTALKNQQLQSRDLIEERQKCTINGADGSVTITVKTLANLAQPGTSSDGVHHTTGSVISARQNNTEICLDYIKHNPESTTYLFKQHWTLQ